MESNASSVCLVTGGAGFIGCAVSGLLADAFGRVVALDSLHPQVHPTRARPPLLDRRVELVVGDVTSPQVWDDLLPELRPEVVLHLAAETGTAQSLTESSRHATVNVVGLTQLLDGLVRHDLRPQRVVLTSSRAVYGEGAWTGSDGGVVYPGQRSHEMLASGQWDFPDARPLPGDADLTRAFPTSVYGATKLAQEHVLGAWCRAMGVDPAILRLQNVYGPGQSLTNAYTGILSLFVRLARAGEQIPVYEDGLILRDFVGIDDVARAVAAATVQGTGGAVYDIGSGVATTILDAARLIARSQGAPEPRVTGQFRDGDVRASWGRINAAADGLGWSPRVSLEDGLGALVEWVDSVLSS
ncbi:MAG: NAD-dependent epimerase/dehydratase family protein [Lapillicoccus sp.]